MYEQFVFVFDYLILSYNYLVLGIGIMFKMFKHLIIIYYLLIIELLNYVSYIK